MNMVFNHRLSRTRGANACAGRAVAPLPPRGRGTRPACPQWLVAICAFFAFTLTAPAADPTISISARQRYPWNGLVDLNFTITGTSGTKYDTSFTAKDIVGNTNITMATIRKADGSAANVTKESLLPGNYKWVWDAAADLPDGFECDQVTVTGVAVELTHLYMVIDLSSGPDSTSYPVSYLDAVPDGGWSDEYKTTKLVLRRIEPGTFKMCGQYNVTLTRPFYIGVFEVTQKQYENITGERPSVFQTSYEVRPVDHLFYYNIRLSFSSDVPLNSFIGKIRERTGISNIDFPTEAQWEYACRAGTTTDYNNGKDNTSGEQDPAMEEIGRYWHNGGSQASNYTKYSSYPLTSGTAAVGSYAPNEWGLYDMHGNVCEWCLDKLDNVEEGMIDPQGTLGFRSIMRGGGWRSRAEECTSIYRRTEEAQYVIYHNAAPNDGGFRVCLTLSAEVKAEEYEVRNKVQLWEGGPYWAEMNIGAKAPWEYGYYFWWGDTMGYKRENDVWVASDGSVTNFFFEAGGDILTYSKSVATLQSEGWITADGALAPEHDAAHVLWGDGWRIPTNLELGDLKSKCDWIWTSTNGVNGYVVRGKDNYAPASIFLPCVGAGISDILYNASSYGYYWSSVPYSGSGRASYELGFYSNNIFTNYDGRDCGLPVRPVQEFSE